MLPAFFVLCIFDGEVPFVGGQIPTQSFLDTIEFPRVDGEMCKCLSLHVNF